MSTEPAITVHPRPGDRFAERYAIERVIGEGGMGRVLLAYDDVLGERVAIKLMSCHSESANALDRFRAEVRLARRITHRHIARVHDLGQAGAVPYFTMEWIDGESLADRLDRVGRLDEAPAIGIARAICQGLQAAHEAGVVHRDLKPANVLLENGGRVVLTDFGIARALGHASASTPMTVGVIGTPDYMAPEQLLGQPVGPSTDLYALGVLLYEVLTGRRPFAGATPYAIALDRLERPAPDPRLERSVSDPLAVLVLALMSPAPGDRPASAALVDARLAELVPAAEAATLPMAAPTILLTTVTPTSTEPVVAVLPFVSRSADADAYLGEAIAADLVDLLGHTRGLRVLASAVTRRHRHDDDPLETGHRLGADVLVEGEVRRVGDRLRVTARLVEVSSGLQVFGERFDVALDGVFSVEDHLAQRLAEVLRVGLSTSVQRGSAPPEAVDVYLRARQLMSARVIQFGGSDGAFALLERCLSLAPMFRPAISASAIATLRAWFSAGADGNRNWPSMAHAAVARAEREAPDLAETQLAVAMLAVQEARFEDAAGAFARSLAIAPTCVDTLEYLGRLQCESGPVEVGVERVRRALLLNPTLGVGHFEVARAAAFEGDWARCDRHIALLQRGLPEGHPIPIQAALRMGTWRGDRAVLSLALERVQGRSGPVHALLRLYAEAVSGIMPPAAGRAAIEHFLGQVDNPRVRSLVLQVAVEVASATGNPMDAMEYLDRASHEALVDLQWLEKCPLVKPLHPEPRFAAIRQRVRDRAEPLWRV